ncbi:MAG: hypothetical protein IJA66_02060 [Alistipes sp.]|nr:hypothetical protein [Alistipes sp.]
MRMIAQRALILLCSLWMITACGRTTTPEFSEIPDDESESGLVTIAYLKSRCQGLSSTIDADISIKGTVVANDLFGEFYKTLVLVDESGGIEILIDRERICADFPLYANVSVFCNGLAVGRVGGKVVLGAKPTGEYTTDRIADGDVSKYLYRQPGDITSAVPRKVHIADLGVEHISDYVLFEDVRFADEEVGDSWCNESNEAFADTERHIVDADGNVLIVRLSAQCEYADEKIPAGRGAVCGILDYSGGAYFLRIANHEIYF